MCSLAREVGGPLNGAGKGLYMFEAPHMLSADDGVRATFPFIELKYLQSHTKGLLD